jgi:hypothetical protein
MTYPSRAMRWVVIMAIGCGHASEPAKVARPAHDAAPADARPADASVAVAEPTVPTAVLARWSSKPATPASPACISGGNDRFIQYADADEPGALRFCLWWNLAKEGMPDTGCWRVDLRTGEYVGQGGVWFSTPQPPRVGLGGGDAAAVRAAPAPTARWRDDGVELCRGTACKRVLLAKPPNAEEHEVVFDDAGTLASVPLGGSAKAHAFATIDVATGTQLATVTIADRHAGAEVVGFIGPTLLVTDCDDKADTCAWDLYDARGGTRIAAVGGKAPLGAGGTAVALDAQRFAAVAGTHLVVQTAAGAVTANVQLPRPPTLRASYVVFAHDPEVIALGPDGRVVIVDAGVGKIGHTLAPPACKR